ncbi:HEAT repeat domain-containing protein [Actinomadura hibisca]|uniref:HEAT repeat domain-containing protein n=1 Tax=Actinomadura hibisca TaxID=68565 RepID=UPI00082FB323|nr:HEAT repeat domain-containing protein [Actinomadura hibisca]
MIAGHQVAFFLREIGSVDPGRRAAAVKGLSRAPGHVERLVALADDPAPQVRAAVALGLGRQDGTVPVEPLLALCSDPDVAVRRRAVNALNRLGATGPAVAAAFVQRLGDAALPNRPLVLAWLRRFEVAVPAEALTSLLAAPDPGLWASAASLLRLLPEADAVFADLVRTAQPEVRRRALDMLASPQAGIPGMGAHAEPEEREAAWRRLWKPEPQVVHALLAALEAETEPYARSRLFGALAARRVVEAVVPAAAWLADLECGPSAAAALGAAGTDEAVELLRQAVVEPGGWGSELHGAAMRALGVAGDVSAAELLFGLLSDPAEAVRLGALDGLGSFFRRFDGSLHGRLERWRAEGSPDLPVPPPDDDPAVRELARRTAERLTRMLVRDVEHANAYHGVLWHIPEVRPLLPELLRHPEGWVRSTALHLAERFDEIDFAGRLRLLDDPHHAVRQGAALSFLQLVERRELSPDEQDALRPHLEAAQEDADQYVRSFTAKALQQLDETV